jgi:hypothetical protein
MDVPSFMMPQGQQPQAQAVEPGAPAEWSPSEYKGPSQLPIAAVSIGKLHLKSSIQLADRFYSLWLRHCVADRLYCIPPALPLGEHDGRGKKATSKVNWK